MNYVVILAQGRSGGTLITRILNKVPPDVYNVNISGENERAFDKLLAFAEAFQNLQRHRNGEFYTIAWRAPGSNEAIAEAVRGCVKAVFGPVQLAGFKEIRYGDQDYRKLEEDIAGLRFLMPEAKLVFNTRKTEDAIRSAWWKDNPDQARAQLDRMRANFAKFHAANPASTYWLPYEDLTPSSPVLRGLFPFLGLDFEESYLEPLAIILR